ncbi:hypothetical protein [Methylobacterium sp. sgz302541]|uniref:hypothetical protein n=1 Tax=unclassified Methylobacterium TaxID=2615210 RepID=UPI003D3330D9
MRYTSVNRTAAPDRLEELMAQIGRLMRHRAYQRDKIVSPLLLRHLPMDAGYAWQGEAALRERLVRASLDAKTVDHLIANARAEFATMLERITA